MRKLGYNERGLASVLDGADDLIKRAAYLFREINNSTTTPTVKAAYGKEVDMCLAEAAQLIATVQAERP